MKEQGQSAEIERLIQLLARLPGMGPRSARRAALFLIKKKADVMLPLASAMQAAAEAIRECPTCGNVDTVSPCTICADPRRETGLLCIVEEVGDVWALERAGVIKGRYHVLGGTLSPLDGVGPEELNLASLLERVRGGTITEVLIALNATVEGQSTAHYLYDQFQNLDLKISRLAQGVPVGGELDYLDEGTLIAAIKARKEM